MKPMNRLSLTAFTLAALTAGVWAQTQTASNAVPAAPAAATPSPASPVVTVADIQALKDALAAQQQQIQALQEQLQRKNEALQPVQPSVGEPATPDAAPAPSPQPVAALGVTGIQQENTASPAPSQNPEDAPQTFDKQMEGPMTIHFRGINITPGGYVEGAFIRRSRALAADLATPYNNVTMPGASQSQIPEFFGSARQSKTTAFVDGRWKNVDLSSYVSADFLSAGVTSTSTQTNSYTLRLRQFWGQAKFTNGWSFLGGQSWSLVTENGKGISPDDDLGRSNDARPRTIDPSYNVGFVFARQYGLRLTKTFGDKVAIAFALENPQATLSSHGNAANYLLGEAGASNSYNTTATYSFNPAPDLIAKIAFDPGFGHYELFGLVDRFTGRVFPCAESVTNATTGVVTVGPNCPVVTDAGTAVGAFNSSKEGGGLGASARWDIAKRITFGLKGFGGSGVGRYGPAGLPDVSINGDGTVHPVKNLMGLSTLELHVTKKLDLVGYGGVEYAARSFSTDQLTGKFVGYATPTTNNTGCYTETAPNPANGSAGFDPGSLANCTADSRSVIEGTVGLWYKFYSGPRGKFQFGAMYSYLTRNTWAGYGGLPAGTNGLEPHGIDNMIFTSFRYYLP
ncbi:MAG: hypothetical protein ABSE40_06720 [Candidatus Sulfotelmatobacter sp.]|jgi:hypothetical protein